MTLKEAKAYVKKNFGTDVEKEEGCTVFKLRNQAWYLPEEGNDSSKRDSSDWVFIDGVAKQDSGTYGAVYYFKDDSDVCPICGRKFE